MQSYLLKNLSDIAARKAIHLREEAQLWDILSRDLKREGGRIEEHLQIPKAAPKTIAVPTDGNPYEGRAFVRIKEATKLMGISRSSLYTEIKMGRLIVKKAGRTTLIPVESIKAWSQGLQGA